MGFYASVTTQLGLSEGNPHLEIQGLINRTRLPQHPHDTLEVEPSESKRYQETLELVVDILKLIQQQEQNKM